MSLEFSLLLIQKLICFAALISSLEFLLSTNTFIKDGIWEWNPIKKNLFLDFLMKDFSFLTIIVLRVLFCIAVLLNFPLPFVFSFLFLTNILISVRWHGANNGGSDFMSHIVLFALMASEILPFQSAQVAAIYFITANSLLSYFISGVVKLKNKNWRNGKELKSIFAITLYPIPNWAHRIASNNTFSFIFSWCTILLECLLPLALIVFPKSVLLFIPLGILFHASITICFGLNRFFWVWISTYPAILYFSGI